MAGRSLLLPLTLLVLAAVAALCGPTAFVGGQTRAPSTALRTLTPQRALPLDMGVPAETSVATALAVSTPGFWANIVTVIVPVTFLIVLYLQSERTKAEEGIEP
mmetsp:Transcript_91891/g.255970  ORF Transcript_91891/g.255970 Transcript_91891/m.255970 type:complete len:104 (-) Transcript_91891:170-481(-)